MKYEPSQFRSTTVSTGCIAKPARVHSDEEATRLRHFYFLLFPNVNMLDFSAAIEPLHAANENTKKDIYSWSIVSESGAPISCSNGMEIQAEALPKNTGPNDCIVICSGNSGYLDADALTLNWLRKHMRYGGQIVTIATGAFTLARLNSTSDLKTTVHWSAIPVFEEVFPEAACLQSRIVADKDNLSCAGGASSMDCFIRIIDSDLGHTTAQEVAEQCIYDFQNDRTSLQRQPISQRIGCRRPDLLAILQTMEDSIDDPRTIEELTSGHATSRRQLERLFKKYLNDTPHQYYLKIRLDRARKLLNGSDLSLMEITVATGFDSVSHFSNCYKKRFGIRPTKDRTEFRRSRF